MLWWILRCGRAASPVWREPPVRTNGATPFSVAISYFAIAGSNPYTSRIEKSLDESILSMSILYESYDIRSIMASARVLSLPQICWCHSLSRNCEQKIVDCIFRSKWTTCTVKLSQSHGGWEPPSLFFASTNFIIQETLRGNRLCEFTCVMLYPGNIPHALIYHVQHQCLCYLSGSYHATGASECPVLP